MTTCITLDIDSLSDKISARFLVPSTFLFVSFWYFQIVSNSIFVIFWHRIINQFVTLLISLLWCLDIFKVWGFSWYFLFYLWPLNIFKLCGIPIAHQVTGGYQLKHCHQKTLHSNALIENPAFITIIIVFIIIVILLHIVKIFYVIHIIILPIIIIIVIVIGTWVWLLREVSLSENNLLCCLSPEFHHHHHNHHHRHK